MPDAFISYSRKDAKAFVARLVESIEERGKDAWVDLADIPPASEWQRDLVEGIEGSDSFVYVISPGALRSAHCQRELEHAVDQRKRIIPIHYAEVDGDTIPQQITSQNWVPSDGYFDDDFGHGVDLLIEAIETDFDWVRRHTRLGRRAAEWEEHDRASSLLLRGEELHEAEAWLADSGGKSPEPSRLQADYILESQRGSRRRQTTILATVIGALIITLALAAVAIWQRREAVDQRDAAQARELATRAAITPRSEPLLRVLLAAEAQRLDPSTEGEAVLRRSLVEFGRNPLITDYAGHNDEVWNAVFDPSGESVLTASVDNTARLWDASTGAKQLVITTNSNVFDAQMSSSGDSIVTGESNGAVKTWDAETGDRLLTLRPHDGFISDAQFSPDGETILTAGDEHVARLWDAGSGDLELTIRARKLEDAAFGPDGDTIVTNGGATTKVWDSGSGELELVLRQDHGQVFEAWYGPQGDTIVTAGSDGTARLWDAATGEPLQTFRQRTNVLDARVSPDGTMVVTGGGRGTLRVWDVESGEALRILRIPGGDEIQTVGFSPDGTEVVGASVDGTARVWSVELPYEQRILRGHTDWIESVAASADGKTIITAGVDKTARIWDAESGKQLVALRGHDDLVNAASMSVDGELAITASYDNTARIWDIGSGKQLTVLRGHDANVYDAALSPDGTMAATAGGDRSARVWDVETGRELMVLRGHGKDVIEVTFSPDGQQIVTGGTDSTAMVWSAETGERLGVLRGHDDWITGIDFSPDGRRVITASTDGTARIWDAETFDELRVLRTQHKLLQIAFDPTGTLAVSAGQDGVARVWSVESGSSFVAASMAGGDAMNGAVFIEGGSAIAFAGQDPDLTIRACSPCDESGEELLATATGIIPAGMSEAEQENLVSLGEPGG